MVCLEDISHNQLTHNLSFIWCFCAKGLCENFQILNKLFFICLRVCMFGIWCGGYTCVHVHEGQILILVVLYHSWSQIHFDCLGNKCEGSTCLCLYSTSIIGVHCHVWHFHMDSGDLALLTEPFPQWCVLACLQGLTHLSAQGNE